MSPDGPTYVAQPLRCRACEARDAASEKFRDDGGSTAGLFFTVSPEEGVSG